MDKRGGWVEGGVHDSERGTWTYSYVLWTYKLSSNISNDDEQESMWFDQHWRSEVTM